MELANTSFPHYESVQAIISTLETMPPNPLKKVQI